MAGFTDYLNLGKALIREYAPAKNALTSTFRFGKQEIATLSANEEFGAAFSKLLQGAERPMVQFTTKTKGATTIGQIIATDGEQVVVKGAVSKTGEVVKGRITQGVKTTSGHSAPNSKGEIEIPYTTSKSTKPVGSLKQQYTQAAEEAKSSMSQFDPHEYYNIRLKALHIAKELKSVPKSELEGKFEKYKETYSFLSGKMQKPTALYEWALKEAEKSQEFSGKVITHERAAKLEEKADKIFEEVKRLVCQQKTAQRMTPKAALNQFEDKSIRAEIERISAELAQKVEIPAEEMFALTNKRGKLSMLYRRALDMAGRSIKEPKMTLKDYLNIGEVVPAGTIAKRGERIVSLKVKDEATQGLKRVYVKVDKQKEAAYIDEMQAQVDIKREKEAQKIMQAIELQVNKKLQNS